MIVNTAYPFMGKTAPLADPNLWGNGAVNVPYQLYSATWNKYENFFGINMNGWVSLTLPARGYNKIELKMNAASSAGGTAKITFLNADDSEISSITQKTSQYQTRYTFDLPPAAKKDGSKVKVEAVQVYHFLRSGTLIE